MLITRTSIFTGVTRTLDIDVTQEAMDRHEKGNDLIQNVFPHLTDDEREFILTGMTPEEWDECFSDAYEEDGYEDYFEDDYND